MKSKPKLIVFSSGTKDGGGSGFENLVTSTWGDTPLLNAEIVAVVCNIRGGGVERRARELGIPFFYFPKEERTAESHQALVQKCGVGDAFVALSGCLWLVPMKSDPFSKEGGLDPRRVFNIHPGPLPHFGGNGMHGMHVHEAVMSAYKNKILHGSQWVTESKVTMHFVTKRYDEGPVIFEFPVPILPTDTPQTLAKEVNRLEHRFQPWVTDLVVNGKISWNGVDPSSLIVPLDYGYKPKK